MWMWPDENDALRVLEYTRRHHRALPIPTYENKNRERAEQAKLRLMVIRQIERQLPAEKLAAIDDAYNAGVVWRDIGAVTGQEHPGSAKNLRDSLYAAVTVPDGPRTPKAGRQADAKRRLAEDQQRREDTKIALEVARHHKEVQAAAQSLLAHRKHLLVNDTAHTWLSGMQTLVEIKHPTSIQQQSLASQVRLAVKEIVRYAEAERKPAATTAAAETALEAAAAVSGAFD